MLLVCRHGVACRRFVVNMTEDEKAEITVFHACGYDIANRDLDHRTKKLQEAIKDGSADPKDRCAVCLLKAFRKLGYG